MRKNLTRWLGGLVLSAIFLWAVLRGVDLAKVGSLIAGANRQLAIPVLLTSAASVIVRAWRWMLCFEGEESLALPDAIFSYSLGNLSGYVIPARLGDLVRVYAVGSTTPISRARALGTLVIERLSDLFAVVIVVSAMLPLFNLPGWVISADVFAAIMCLAALIVVYVLARKRDDLRIPGWVQRRHALDVGAKLGLRLLDGFGAVREAKRAGAILLLAFVVWLLTVASYVTSFQAMSIPLGWREGALLTGVLALVAIVPAGPGFAGSFELAAVALLGLFGVDRSLTIAYVEFTRLTAFGSLALLTLLGFLAIKVRQALKPGVSSGTEPEPQEASVIS